MEIYNLSEVKDASKYSTNELCAAIREWKGSLPNRFASMCTEVVKAPVGLASNEAWAEMIIREKARKDVISVKGVFDFLTTDKCLTYSPEGSVVKEKSGRTEKVDVYAGHFTRETKKDDEKFNALVTVENTIDAMLFPIQKYDDKKGTMILSDREEVARANFPEFPVSKLAASMKTANPETIRAKCMVDADKFGIDAFCKTVSQNFPKNMEYVGHGCFSIKKPNVLKSDGTVKGMYQQIWTARKLRGNDNDLNSVLTRGYYFGYMSNHMYRSVCVISDVMRMLRTAGTRFLRIAKQSGLFNSVVIWSLISNGVIIHSEGDYQMPVLNVTQLDGDPKPGLYSKVITNSIVLRYVEFNDRPPDFKNGVVYMQPILERLNELAANTTIKCFSIIYLREELEDVAKHLLPSCHAHSGQVIWSQVELQEPLDIAAYVARVVSANSYKNYAAYVRNPWILRDPFAYREKFNITQKQIKEYKEFETIDFSVGEEFTTTFSYDAKLGHLSDNVREIYKTLAEGKKLDEKDDTAKQFVYVTEQDLKIPSTQNSDQDGPTGILGYGNAEDFF